VCYGKPVEIPKDLDPEAQAEYMRGLEEELNRLTDWVDRDAGTR
jgi:hypothetical protein